MKASLNNLHHQDIDWLRELDFYREEIATLVSRLEEVASKNTGKEVVAQVEHFQNKFIMLREQLDILHHDIKTRENEVEAVAKERPEHIDEHFKTVKNKTLGRMKDFTGGFADTRFEFNKFLAKTF